MSNSYSEINIQDIKKHLDYTWYRIEILNDNVTEIKNAISVLKKQFDYYNEMQRDISHEVQTKKRGRPFKYASEEEKRLARKEKEKAWKEKHKEKVKSYNASYYNELKTLREKDKRVIKEEK